MSLSLSNVFDAIFYRAANPDLSSFNNAQALSHFQTYNLNEGRLFSPLINLGFYRASNPDHLNNSQLLQHFEIFGINEERKSSPCFDAGYYKVKNADLTS
ncbi:MAG: hypothetical protein V7K47_15570 [Nostoc sp.]